MYNIKKSAAIYADSHFGRTRFEHRASSLKIAPHTSTLKNGINMTLRKILHNITYILHSHSIVYYLRFLSFMDNTASNVKNRGNDEMERI